METRLIDGKAIAATILDEVAERALALAGSGRPPTLVFVTVGTDPSTASYNRGVQRACQKAHVEARTIELPADVSPSELESSLDLLSADPAVHGIILQRPLPPPLDAIAAGRHIALARDIDCANPDHFGLLFLGRAIHLPCTPAAVVEILRREGVSPVGRHVVIVGRSPVVGRPLAHMLSEKGPDGDATVTLCHSRTTDLSGHCFRADILVCAAGAPGLVGRDHIRPGAVVIDVSVNSVPDPFARGGFRLVGDVIPDEALGRASLLTPVPGGVGPVTVAMLLKNTLDGAGRIVSPPRSTLERAS